jgi:nitroreductase
MIKELVEKSRSYRRFHQDVTITNDTLRELVNLARLSPSGGNVQPLKFLLSHTEESNALIFPRLRWASYLKDWEGPEEGERPSAYIIILGDMEISQSFGVNPGIAVQSILLGAVEKGFGGCIIASIKKDELRQVLEIPLRYKILLVLALGKPAETVIIEPLEPGGDFKYWRDENSVHHVPKRSLDELLIT